MPVNKRRHANAVPLASFATWVLIGLFTGTGGLGYVWCKNQLHTTGRAIKDLERELADLQNKNEVSRANIARFSSTAALQQRFSAGFIKLVPIANERIVSIAPRADTDANQLRAVSNRRMSP